MAKYVDGFVLSVPKKATNEYKRQAAIMMKLCKKYGALDYKECIGVNLHPKGMKEGRDYLPFPKLVKPKAGEAIWFSYIVYKSKKHRDQVNAKLMKSPEMDPKNWEGKKMPFDMKRMAVGGFNVEVG